MLRMLRMLRMPCVRVHPREDVALVKPLLQLGPGIADSEVPPVDMKPVQVNAFPSHGSLDDVVKIGDVRFARHQKTTPDHGTDATK